MPAWFTRSIVKSELEFKIISFQSNDAALSRSRDDDPAAFSHEEETAMSMDFLQLRRDF